MNGVDPKVIGSHPHELKGEDEDAIESDVQNLLEEMATTFKSFSETVFAKGMFSSSDRVKLVPVRPFARSL